MDVSEQFVRLQGSIILLPPPPLRGEVRNQLREENSKFIRKGREKKERKRWKGKKKGEKGREKGKKRENNRKGGKKEVKN